VNKRAPLNEWSQYSLPGLGGLDRGGAIRIHFASMVRTRIDRLVLFI
jgi:hypothetical protein